MKPSNSAAEMASIFRRLTTSNGRLLGLFLGFLLLATGCKRNSDATVDPQMAETLSQLTTELHHTMVGRKLNRNFDEFVALRHLDVPPPPTGKKYAISENWKVILVDQ
jgi:hypothetical protein